MTVSMSALLVGSILYLVLVAYCCAFTWRGNKVKGANEGICQTSGSREIQADRAQIWINQAGTMAVLADGIGKENTGAVSAQITVDTILDRFESYQKLDNPVYFLKTAFFESNVRIQKTIGERRGGASVGAVFIDRTHLYYALVGDIRIALVRGEEIIPLSKGQTLDVLAGQAYEEGKISKRDAVWSAEEKRIWSYLGQDGFHEIEVCESPIRMKPGDKVLLASKGICEELSWREMEDILIDDSKTAQELAERIVRETEQKDAPDKDNGSVILIRRTEALIR